MADRRRLQGEIERCHKKVQEGVEQFEDIWQKAHNAPNTNQKEKYEADLKKEIKKLQRLRDQIKTWLASSEIKDKKLLTDDRKLIETQMERFKVLERETKTKAYSKEGLGGAAKLDPAQKEIQETNQWLSDSIARLNVQVDKFECEVEANTVAIKKGKKKDDKEKTEKIEELKQKLEKHRYHVYQLEALMRMLDNSTVTAEEVKSIKEDLEFYMDAIESSDPDFTENEYMYADIEGMDSFEDYLQKKQGNFLYPAVVEPNKADEDDVAVRSIQSTSPTSTQESPTPSPGLNHSSSGGLSTIHDHSSTTTVTRPTPVKTQSSSVSRSGSVSSTSTTTSNHASNTHRHHASQDSQDEPMDTRSPAQTPPTKNHVDKTIATPSSLPLAYSKVIEQTSKTTAPPPPTISSTTGTEVWANGGRSITPGKTSQVPPAPQTTASMSLKYLSQKALPNNASVSQIENDPLEQQPPQQVTTMSSNFESTQNGLNAIPSAKVPSSTPVTLSSTTSSTTKTTLSLTNAAAPSIRPESRPESESSPGIVHTFEANIPPVLGVAPLSQGKTGKKNLPHDCQVQLSLLEAASRHAIHPSDSQRLRLYLPSNPCPTPSYYPQQALPHSDSLDFFLKLSTDALFFIFYFMEGTKAQFLSAKALKKQSWRFHTKYMMWFQRHEEPRQITDEYEQGTYIYFDYEKWGQRKKEHFTFEYCYLEDRDLN